MTSQIMNTPEFIRRKRQDNPKMRERDLAQILNISEAELVAAHCGYGVTRIEPRLADFLSGIKTVGTVMALTRNESAVHEKIGIYEKAHSSEGSAIVLGEDIDLRIFPSLWVHGFAVEKQIEGETRHSLQFFDQAGDAVHKVHLRPESNLAAYHELVAKLISADQSAEITIKPIAPRGPSITPSEDVTASLRERWTSMQDVHEFINILRTLKLSRHQAVRLAGEDFTTRLDPTAVSAFFNSAARSSLTIMCFVGSRGCIQIHTGPVKNIKFLGPWINVMDDKFHLHLRLDHLVEVWAVRKPVKEGYVTSIEAYDNDGHLVIQFFGKRHEGEDELEEWRALVNDLPRMLQSTAA